MKDIAYCFDLDGTVTSQEILPQIAKEVSLFEEIKLLTNITLKGIIPFENSFKLRVKLLSSVPISRVCNIVNEIALDKEIAEFIRNNKENCYIVTGNLDVWIKELIAKELGCKFFSSVAEHEGDSLIGLDSILNKGEAIKSLKDSYKTIVSIGDSMNDCSMAEQANISIAYGGIHEPVESLIQISDYVIYDSNSLTNLLNNFKSYYNG